MLNSQSQSYYQFQNLQLTSYYGRHRVGCVLPGVLASSPLPYCTKDTDGMDPYTGEGGGNGTLGYLDYLPRTKPLDVARNNLPEDARPTLLFPQLGAAAPDPAACPPKCLAHAYALRVGPIWDTVSRKSI